MPRRSGVGLDDIAAPDTLALAFWRAARGKRDRPEVRAMAARLLPSLRSLGEEIRGGLAPLGEWTRFVAYDPKERTILAPSFRDRVVHHAMIVHMGPVLDRALVEDTFACRTGKGTLAAVLRAQRHARRFAWFVKVDVRAFFASVDHGVVLALLERRFKNPDLLALCARVLASTPGGPGVGLPIGALTSQHFANFYLDGLDRLLLERLRVRAMVRYMDDVVWWCDTREEAVSALVTVRAWVAEHRRLAIKPGVIVSRSSQGLPFLGFRVLPGTLQLLRRRRRRYVEARERWEARWLAGAIDADELQAGGTAALAITAHANAVGWRREQLRRRPPVDG